MWEQEGPLDEGAISALNQDRRGKQKAEKQDSEKKTSGQWLENAPVNRLNTDCWPAASKRCKRMQLQVLITPTEALGVRFFVLGKWLRASGTQVSETQAKLNLNRKKNTPEK